MRDTICYAEFCPHQKGFTVKSLETNGGEEKCYPDNGKPCFHASSNIQKRTLDIFEVGKSNANQKGHIIIVKVS